MLGFTCSRRLCRASLAVIAMLLVAGGRPRASADPPPCVDYSHSFRYVSGLPVPSITYDLMGYTTLVVKGRKAYAYQYGMGLRVIDLATPSPRVTEASSSSPLISRDSR